MGEQRQIECDQPIVIYRVTAIRGIDILNIFRYSENFQLFRNSLKTHAPLLPAPMLAVWQCISIMALGGSTDSAKGPSKSAIRTIVANAKIPIIATNIIKKSARIACLNLNQA